MGAQESEACLGEVAALMCAARWTAGFTPTFTLSLGPRVRTQLDVMWARG